MAWEEHDNKLSKHFVFKDFKEAFAFLGKVALVAEDMQHHPEIQNTYNKVTLNLSTHDAGDLVTEKDWALARAIDALD